MHIIHFKRVLLLLLELMAILSMGLAALLAQAVEKTSFRNKSGSCHDHKEVCVCVSLVLGSSARLGSRLAAPPVGRVSACLAWWVACWFGWSVWLGGRSPLGSPFRCGWGEWGSSCLSGLVSCFCYFFASRAEGHKRSLPTLAWPLYRSAAPPPTPFLFVLYSLR